MREFAATIGSMVLSFVGVFAVAVTLGFVMGLAVWGFGWGWDLGWWS